MPLNANDIEENDYLRLLVMGAPKSGKSVSVLRTCEKPAYVINCDDKLALKGALQFTDEFDYDLVTDLGSGILDQMESAIAYARKHTKALGKDGKPNPDRKYKTIIWDTMSFYARHIEQVFLDSTDSGKGPDGRRAWPQYKKNLINVVERLFMCEAHVIVLSHYLEAGGASVDGQVDKEGPGIIPMLGGQARREVPGLFQDVVFLEKQKDGERVFTTNIDGVWGPGCRSLKGYNSVPADVMGLWEKMKAQDSARKND